MTNRSPQPSATCQPYGMVRAGSGEVVVDVADAAVTRLLELLERRPSLFGPLGRASGHGGSRGRHAAIVELLADPDVRGACTVHLSVEDAVQLATEIIAAATPNHSPGLARISVGGRGKNETTDHVGKDAR
jgi:hypothetical protein